MSESMELVRYWRWQGAFGAMWREIGEVTPRLLQHARAAVEAERAACLREATSRAHSCPHVEYVADAIRARGDR